MKYSLNEIKGRHHRMFAPKDVVDSDDYKSFWKRLASGESITGIFKRMDSKGSTVWLNAIYNPILNANKEVVKVVKFATDITQQQEMLAESKGILEGINTTMATIEFTPDGTVVDANKNFLAIMEYSLDEIRGVHHRKFAPLDVVESEEYRTFWSKLSSGEAISGVFRRVSSSGATVWLNATYNPIVNANGKVVKVIKFASDITTTQKTLETSEVI
jgi:methyl-accepting chemotaxis protein